MKNEVNIKLTKQELFGKIIISNDDELINLLDRLIDEQYSIENYLNIAHLDYNFSMHLREIQSVYIKFNLCRNNNLKDNCLKDIRDILSKHVSDIHNFFTPKQVDKIVHRSKLNLI